MFPIRGEGRMEEEEEGGWVRTGEKRGGWEEHGNIHRSLHPWRFLCHGHRRAHKYEPNHDHGAKELRGDAHRSAPHSNARLQKLDPPSLALDNNNPAPL